MIILTGGAGFIGSNILKKLNENGNKDILVVDNFDNYAKYKNLINLSFLDFIDKNKFINDLESNKYDNQITAILHQGACSSTTELDLNYLIKNNYEYSKKLLKFSIENKIPFIYASSASIYGNYTKFFNEDKSNENPINPYAFSKYLFDNYVRSNVDFKVNKVVGLRYFNVYGPNEEHKKSMASTIYHFNKQLKETNTIRLFGSYDGYENGTQKRDFIYVDDCVDTILWFLNNNYSGIYNLGTGAARSFNEVANLIIKWHNLNGKIEYVDFPENLKGSYQSYTRADMNNLFKIGFKHNFLTLEEGVNLYLNKLNNI